MLWRIQILFLFLRNGLFKWKFPINKTHSPLCVSLITGVCPHLIRLFSLFRINHCFIYDSRNLLGWGGELINKTSLQRLRFDISHRFEPNGRVLFSCFKQSAIILLEAVAEIECVVPSPDVV